MRRFGAELDAAGHVAHLLADVVALDVDELDVLALQSVLPLRLLQEALHVFQLRLAARLSQKAELVAQHKKAEQDHGEVEQRGVEYVLKGRVHADEQAQDDARRHREDELFIVEVGDLLFVELAEKAEIQQRVHGGEHAQPPQHIVEGVHLYAAYDHQKVPHAVCQMLRRLRRRSDEEDAPPRFAEAQFEAERRQRQRDEPAPAPQRAADRFVPGDDRVAQLHDAVIRPHAGDGGEHGENGKTFAAAEPEHAQDLRGQQLKHIFGTENKIENGLPHITIAPSNLSIHR